MPSASDQTTRVLLFHGAANNGHRSFIYLLFSEEYRDFRICRVNRAGEEIIETETSIPVFLDSALHEEKQAFSKFLNTILSL
jgi:hypothetical protein